MKTRKTAPPPIAIIGCAVRLPGGIHSLAGLWDLLANHRDAVTETADQRCDPKYFHLPSEELARGAGRNRLQLRLAREQPGTIYTKAGGFLESLEEFDADFFGIGPREASRIDPQHRILVEVAWNALEDAGQSPGGYPQRNPAGGIDEGGAPCFKPPFNFDDAIQWVEKFSRSLRAG